MVLVTLPGTDVHGILAEVQRQTEQLPRGSTVQAALVNSSVVQTSSQQEAAFISNRSSTHISHSVAPVQANTVQAASRPDLPHGGWLTRYLHQACCGLPDPDGSEYRQLQHLANEWRTAGMRQNTSS